MAHVVITILGMKLHITVHVTIRHFQPFLLPQSRQILSQLIDFEFEAPVLILMEAVQKMSYINMHMNAQRPQDMEDGPFLVHVVIS